VLAGDKLRALALGQLDLVARAQFGPQRLAMVLGSGAVDMLRSSDQQPA
jgi:hypothetical protein